jgi:hypothetical protein
MPNGKERRRSSPPRVISVWLLSFENKNGLAAILATCLEQFCLAFCSVAAFGIWTDLERYQLVNCSLRHLLECYLMGLQGFTFSIGDD